MSSDETYLETFIEDLSTLPSEVKRNLELMRVMDRECSSLLSRLRETECIFLHRAEEAIAGIKLPPDDAPLRCKAKVKTAKTEDGTSVKWYTKVSEDEWHMLKAKEEEKKKKKKAEKERDGRDKINQNEGDSDDGGDNGKEKKESSDEEEDGKVTSEKEADDNDVDEEEEEDKKPLAVHRRSLGRKRRRQSGRSCASMEPKTNVAKKRRRKKNDDDEEDEEEEDTKILAKRSPRKKAKRRGRPPKRKVQDEDYIIEDEDENDSDNSNDGEEEVEEGKKIRNSRRNSKHVGKLIDMMEDDADEEKSKSDKQKAKDAASGAEGSDKGRTNGDSDYDEDVAFKSGKGVDKNNDENAGNVESEGDKEETLEEFVLSKEDLRKYVPLTEQFRSAIWDPAAMVRMAGLRQDVRQRAEEKVAVAEQTYALVDETVKRLDRDLAKFEELLKGSGAFEATTGGAKPNDLAAIQVTPNSQDWILAKVISQDQETGMYKLADEDVESNKVYNLPESQVVVLGGVDRLSRGDAIYAVYPDTTSFYQASVAHPPRKVSGGESFVMVNFNDDADERGITHDKAVLMKHVMRVPYGVLA
mmetsp:Transcript_21429/g.62615  ORF Transcript_21429/g.62615 Transcript_21429/m.62615 type:complete len:584 (-) Transcript_21429:376-2127(-)